jgi:hypothetical protein
MKLYALAVPPATRTRNPRVDWLCACHRLALARQYAAFGAVRLGTRDWRRPFRRYQAARQRTQRIGWRLYRAAGLLGRREAAA